MANEFLMNFVVARRRKVRTFQDEYTAKGTEIHCHRAYEFGSLWLSGDVRSKRLLHQTDSVSAKQKPHVNIKTALQISATPFFYYQTDQNSKQ